MKKTLLAVILGLVACAGCAGSRGGPNVPTSSTIPCAFVEENEDAWLHEHCELTRFGSLRTHRTFDEQELPPNSNFVEMISITSDMTRVKIFRCPTRPGWYTAATWKAVATK